ncbi:MAG: discoidin domain-containing protein, partial [Methanosarcinales archaeon]|nr:discoidin domain-containing protein [Methanosarcinales archaeon]
FINTNSSVSDSSGSSTTVFNLPDVYYSFNITSVATKGIITGKNHSITSTLHLRMWVDPAEALVGHSSWPAGVTPVEYRNLTINVEFLTKAGHIYEGQDITADIYRYDGTVLSSVALTKTDGLYSGTYVVTDNGPEGMYWVELREYPGIKQYFNVVEWGCARCHKDEGMGYHHYYSHTVSSGAYGQSDGPVYPSNFSKEYVHEMHPIVDNPPWSTSNCNYHNNAKDWNCVKCHPTEVLPSACPDCHNSANNRWGSILSEEYGADVHAGISRDMAQGKTATSSNGGNPSFAVDNDEKTAWTPEGVTNQVIEIDFGMLYPIDGVRIAMDNYKATYTIEGWDDTQWVGLVSSTTYTNYGNENIYSFTERDISKVRLTVSA